MAKITFLDLNVVPGSTIYLTQQNQDNSNSAKLLGSGWVGLSFGLTNGGQEDCLGNPLKSNTIFALPFSDTNIMETSLEEANHREML